MSTSDLPKVTLIPFSRNAKDWTTWRTQFLALNIGTGIPELIRDDYEPPVPMTDTIKKRSQLLYRNLIMCTRDAGTAGNIVIRLKYASTYDGIGAWKALSRKFERSTKSHRINDVLRSFHSSSYDLSLDPETYLHNLEYLRSMAEYCGEKYHGVINDLLIQNKIVDELENYYTYHVASFNAYVANQERQAEINGEELEIDILELIEPTSREHNNKAAHKTRRGIMNPPAAVFVAKSTPDTTITCLWCGKGGHYAAVCFKKNKDLSELKKLGSSRPTNFNQARNKRPSYRRRNSDSKFKPQNGTKDPEIKSCVICKNRGHRTRDCPHLSTGEQHRKAASDPHGQAASAIAPCLNDETSNVEPRRNKWIIDSGSTYP